MGYYNSRKRKPSKTQVRESYHPQGREEKAIYITASKTRLIEIYNDLKSGFKLDGRGFKKN